MSSRGLRLIKALDVYSKTKPNLFDSSVILSKVKLHTISEGTSLSSFKVEKSMCNGGQTLHGGFIAACIDTLATFSHLGNTGKIAWTMNLHVDFISAAAIGEEITVKTSVLRPGMFTLIEARFTTAQGRLVAKGVTSMLDGREEYQKYVKEVYSFDPHGAD